MKYPLLRSGSHLHKRSWTRAPLMLIRKYTNETARLPCWLPRIATPTVNLRNPLYKVTKHTNHIIHPVYETQGRYHQKSKIGISLATQKYLCSPKKLKEKIIFQRKNRIFFYKKLMKSYFSERAILSLFTFFKIVTWGVNGKPTELTLGQFQIMFIKKCGRMKSG